MTSVGLLVSTYNWPEALRCSLESIARQSRLPGEVIVADDGSGDATAEVVRAFRDRLPLRHVWHPDEGFRAAGIRNKAIAAARSDYLIVLDGDLLLHRDVVADHTQARLEGCFRQGSRLPTTDALTRRLLSRPGLVPGFFTSGVRRRYKLLRMRLLAGRIGRASRDVDTVRSCHLGVWRQDLIRVNGFNEDMVGWGKEDNELAARLVNAGVVRRNLRLGAITFHLNHTERSRGAVAANEAILLETQERSLVRCARGLDQWLNRVAEFERSD